MLSIFSNFFDQYHKHISTIQEVLSTPDVRERQQAINKTRGILDEIVLHPLHRFNADTKMEIKIKTN